MAKRNTGSIRQVRPGVLPGHAGRVQGAEGFNQQDWAEAVKRSRRTMTIEGTARRSGAQASTRCSTRPTPQSRRQHLDPRPVARFLA